MKDNLDIERLHKVALGTVQGRGVGKTRLIQENIINHLQCGHDTIHVAVKDHAQARYNIANLVRLFRNNNIKVLNLKDSLIETELGYVYFFTPSKNMVGFSGMLLEDLG